MTLKEFDSKWSSVNVDEMSDEELIAFKNDCFEMYEDGGFLDVFDSPYDDNREHNGMHFNVIKRATSEEVDIEALPLWFIEFENGDTAYCYPEEITKIEKNKN